MTHGLIAEIAKWVVPRLLTRVYRKIGPLFDTKPLQPIAELTRRHRPGTWVNRSQPDPNPSQRRANDVSFPWPEYPLTYG